WVEKAVDQTTGTIRLKATFANEDRRLWPGQFANVELTLAVEKDAIVVPSQAIQSGQQGSQFVFVVKEDSSVESRRVVVKRTQGSEAIIGDGLRAGESVVVDGQGRLVPGTNVEVRRPEAPGPRPASTTGAGARGRGGGPGEARARRRGRPGGRPRRLEGPRRFQRPRRPQRGHDRPPRRLVAGEMPPRAEPPPGVAASRAGEIAPAAPVLPD